MQSLGVYSLASESQFSFNGYIYLVKSKEFLESLWISFRVSLISTLLSGVIGLYIVKIIFTIGEGKGSKYLKSVFQLPLLVPHIASAYLIGLLLMKSGWISSIAYLFGFINSIEEFPSLINNTNSIGIIVTYLWKEVPFIILMLIPVVNRIEGSWLEIGRIYGCSRKRFFSEVVRPILMPTWISSMLIVFAFTFGDFEVPYLLGVTYPKFLSVYAYDIYINGELNERGIALAANFILALITIIIGLIAYKISRKSSITKEKRW
ncbi:MAG: ABC transporter permease subunit [Clostridium sp.]|uniref:ABC transporter permease n=1 Tax=Clostridium sp. TaxID=1506 RepID=UPI002FC87F1B